MKSKVDSLIESLVLDLSDKKYYEDFDTSAYGDTLEPGSAPAPSLYNSIVDIENPNLIIEVGSYLGYSAIGMAKRIREKGSNCKIICVDTFLGGPDHFFMYRKRHDIRLGYKNGYPTLYQKFISNVILNDVQDVIYPLPFPSTVAFKILEKLMTELDVKADVIFIDGSHETFDVYMDMFYYFQLLGDKGVMIGDDWAWTTVREGVNQFVTQHSLQQNLTILENQIHWVLRK